MQVETDLTNSVCNRYEIENVVCPLKLKNKIFTTGAIDNINHNPSWRDAKDSFHGTAISLTQHPTDNCPGIDRDVAVLDPSDIRPKELFQLPEDYVNVPAVLLMYQIPFVIWCQTSHLYMNHG